MLVVPAIDLQAGRCVRLKQGQFDQVTQFDVAPVERSLYFKQSGAQRLHIVDLDGARMGAMQQLPLICAMLDCGITVQAGGGIRTLDQAKRCIDSGISHLVIGSIAISNPEVTTNIIQEIKPEHIILALDVRIDHEIPVPAINGWQMSSQSNLWEVVGYYHQLGINDILCTDISCDGMMSGPNFNLYQQAVERFPNISWQASGGIRNREDIATLESLGVAAAILGLTLYQGSFDLTECLQEYA
ncbi:phosphoribosylformimino-5-aminoimidazole carboxamide ribotide isomerase [Legionella moravica]|uniref:1-(5-phosphoribosyl)-5-[(5-phosphoribosylamino)methylideneamino] imidazole-4-carboxamide isomerase n=1 Tax=Legionella moravica TaxID=39962 RepID=A0A378K1C7_9GAMM|nr:1-(5-phosphoribosyl)-5-[(5-phosphoribosylamino)methylideneamino] imidazole-4-carboxamide isomerase [Legionella moravica]KTD32080.1 phosphoribosylformimino-5-aminoimidazole carboxamide ribotide isomerase [Legionella moravica]STX63059.1 phosphoribosylformimino-5-aminoimidazole carboxamide ribotide isomerase [Legionella moravica]